MKRLAGIILAFIMALTVFPQMVFAEQPVDAGSSAGAQAKQAAETKNAKRTILFYCCGTDLEADAAMATYNLKQILKSHFSSDDDIRFIVMTGGCSAWQLDDDENPDNENGFLAFPEGTDLPENAVEMEDPNKPEKTVTMNPKGRISNVYNQIWEARGADAADENGYPDPNAGKLVLLDGDGLTGKGVKGKNELMTNPEILKGFINYGVTNYPAEKYDLILWDHGGGPQGGYGYDQHYAEASGKSYENLSDCMSLEGILDALRNSKVVDCDGDGQMDGKFDFVDFDACQMGNLELSLILADYTRYYIASAEIKPGYGQFYGPGEGVYKGWLDELGDPSKDAIYNGENGTFELGKVIVDDFYEFYSKDTGEGSNRKATLAVFDTEKMVRKETGFVPALYELSRLLRTEAQGREGETIQFYDELKSFFKSIDYSDSHLYDLADMIAFLGVADSEVNGNRTAGEGIDSRNIYTGLSEVFSRWFSHTGNLTENDFMYAKCTLNETTEEHYYYHRGDEDGESGRKFGSLFSSGLSIYFPDHDVRSGSAAYYEAIDPVLKSMPVKDDGRYDFLKNYEEVVADYDTIQFTGRTVSEILHNRNALYPEKNEAYGDKEKVTYELVMENWNNEFNNAWRDIISVNLSKRRDGVEGSESWLRKLIPQIAEDAVTSENVTAAEVQYKDEVGYKVKVNQGDTRITESVERNIIAELPVLDKYIKSLDKADQHKVKRYGKLSLGSVKGTEGDFPEDASLEEMTEWYNTEGSIWDFGPLEQKWYAIKDAEGKNHVASIIQEEDDVLSVPALFGSEKDGKEEERMLYLKFSKDPADDSPYKLKSLCFVKPSSHPAEIDPSSLTGELTVMPILSIEQLNGDKTFYAPISKAPFTINKDNAASITLDMADVRKIPDIRDTNGDGKALNSAFSVTDLYGYHSDITESVIEASDDPLKSISLAEVKTTVYSGKEKDPVITCRGKILKEGADYSLETVPDVIGEGEAERLVVPELKNARKYKVVLTGKGKYTGTAYKPFVIKKAENHLAVKGKTAAVSSKALSRKTQRLAVSKVLQFKKKGMGTVTYAKESGNSKITIDKKTGTVTLRKGLKKNTYTVKVRVRAAGNTNYKPSKTQTASFTIRVK